MKQFPQLLFNALRYRKTLIAVIVVLWPIVIFGAMRAWDGMSNRVEDWLPEAFEETKYLEQFVNVFGSDELLMISWPGCDLDDPRLGELHDRLLTPIVVDGREVLYFQSVITGTGVFNALTSEPMNLERKEALDRLSKWLISPDGLQTSAVLTVSEAGAADRHALLARVWEVIDEIGIDAKDAHVAGPTIESIAIDNASRNGILTLNLVSIAVCLGMTFFCLRNVAVSFLVLGVAIFNQYLTMALVYYSGVTFDSVMLMGANLAFVITFSMGIYLVNYYRAAMSHLPPRDAVLRAMQNTFLPAIISATTTTVGLLSLVVSNLIPIARFGLFSGIAVILVVLTILIYIPLFLAIWPISSWQKKPANNAKNETDDKTEANAKSENESEPTVTDRTSNFAERFVFPISSRWCGSLFILCLVLAVIGFWGINKITASVGLRQFLMGHTKVIGDYCYLEDKIGPLIPIEILVHAEQNEDPRVMVKRLRTVYQVQDALQEHFQDAAVIGLKNFLPAVPPEQGGVRQMAANTAFRKELSARRGELDQLGYFAEKEGSEYWRITIRTYAMRDVDYAEFLKKVEQSVSQVLNNSEINPDHQLNYIVTGGIPLTAKTQNQLIKDMIDSFLLAFVLIALNLSLLFRNLIAGFLGILPSVMPGIIVFGFMGWYGIPLEIGTALTACSALGISVDATIHFVTWFRESVAKGSSRTEAVLHAYRRCSQGMLQTTLICSFSLLVFAVSSFIPMIRFGICMFVLLMLSYVSTMYLLPAILCSPLGVFFCRSKKPH